jgi:uncharacterized membrane protein YccC
LAHFGLTPEALHQGAQLAAAVLLGYGVAVVLSLPERFWVVITVLIVMRADADSALDVGWDRVRGTVVGALAGLAGVYLVHQGANTVVVSLAVVSALAFGSAALPLLRSSAVAALIILGAGDIAGHSPIQVALLRVLQIGIGVGVSVALVLATARYSTRARLLGGSAALLRRLGLQLQMRGVRKAPTEEQAQASSIAVRNALQGLALLAGSADRKFPWSRAPQKPVHELHHRRIAALTGRIVQDAVVLNRVLDLVQGSDAAPLARAAVDAASAGLTSVAGAISAKGRPSLGALRQLAQDCEAGEWGEGAFNALLAAPLRLLLDDLQQLCGSVAGEMGST